MGRMRIVVLGLSLSSSWGNGHATTYRALLRAMARLGHDILFLERDVPWYAENRDLERPDFCELRFYRDFADLKRFTEEIRKADVVIVGSFVPQGVSVGHFVQHAAQGITAFYDIDTPVTLAKLRRGDFEYISPSLIPGYDLYLSFTGGPTLRLIEKNYDAPAACALYCSADTDVYRRISVPERYDLGYLGTYSADRQAKLERLLIEPARRLPQQRFVVAGSQYPIDIDWPANVARIDHIPPQEHPNFFSACRFTLNITRADMVQVGFSPSVRLFEAAACGCPTISDNWLGLESIFAVEDEILVVETADQVSAILTNCLERDRLALASRMRDRVLREHTAEHRATQLDAYLAAARKRRGQPEKHNRQLSARATNASTSRSATKIPISIPS